MSTKEGKRGVKLLAAFAVFAMVACCFTLIDDEVEATTELYVNTSYTGGTEDGGETTPFKTLEAAIAAMTGSTTFMLQSDAVIDSTTNFSNAVTFRSDSSTVRTVTVKGVALNGANLTLGVESAENSNYPVEMAFAEKNGTMGSITAAPTLLEDNYVKVSYADLVGKYASILNVNGVYVKLTGNATITADFAISCNLTFPRYTLSDVKDGSNDFAITFASGGKIVEGDDFSKITMNNPRTNVWAAEGTTICVKSTAATANVSGSGYTYTISEGADVFSIGNRSGIEGDSDITFDITVSSGADKLICSFDKGNVKLSPATGKYTTSDTLVIWDKLTIAAGMKLEIADGQYMTVEGKLLSADSTKPAAGNVITTGYVNINAKDAIGDTVAFTDSTHVSYDESIMSEDKFSGKNIIKREIQSSAIGTLTENSNIASGGVMIVYGKLIIPSNVTLTIEAGGTLIFAATNTFVQSEINGKIVMNNKAGSVGGTILIYRGNVNINSDNAFAGNVTIGGSDSVIVDGKTISCSYASLLVAKDKTLTFTSDSTLIVDCTYAENLDMEGGILNYGSMVFNGSVTAEVQAIAPSSQDTVAGIVNFGNILYDSMKASGNVRINMACHTDNGLCTPVVDVKNYSVVGTYTSASTGEGKATGTNSAAGTISHTLSISDSFMALERVSGNVNNYVFTTGSVISITPKATASLTGVDTSGGYTVSSGTDAVWSGVTYASGIKITENIESKKVDYGASANADGHNYQTGYNGTNQYYQHMDVEGTISVGSTAKATWTSSSGSGNKDVSVMASCSVQVSMESDVASSPVDVIKNGTAAKQPWADVRFNNTTIGEKVTLDLGGTKGANAEVVGTMKVNGSDTDSSAAVITAPGKNTVVTIGESGHIIIGTNVTADTKTKLESTTLNGVRYVKTSSGSQTIMLDDVNNAINDADGKTITALSVYGDQAVTQNLQLVAGVTMTISGNGFSVGTEDVTNIRLTLADGAKVTGNIEVYATLFANNLSDLSGATASADVSSKSKTDPSTGWIKYSNLSSAIGDAARGDSVYLARDTTLRSDLTIPIVVWLVLDKYKLTLYDGVTLTVNGILDISSGDILASAFTLKAENVSSSSGNRYSATIVNNQTMDSDSPFKYAGGTAATVSAVSKGATGTPVSLMNDGAPIAGAYYTVNDDPKYYEINPVGRTAESTTVLDLNMIDGDITIYGANTEEDLEFVGSSISNRIVISGNNVTVDGVEIVNSLEASISLGNISLEVPSTAVFSGTISIGASSLSVKSVSGLTVEYVTPSTTATGLAANYTDSSMKLTGTVVYGAKGSISLDSGKAYIGSGFALTDGTNSSTFTVAKGATLSLEESLQLPNAGGDLIIAGELIVPAGSSISVDTVQVTGTLTAEAATTGSGKLTANTLYAGITAADVKSGSADSSAKLSGNIAANVAYVSGSAELDSTASSTLATKKTSFVVDGSTWFTVYGTQSGFTLPTRANLKDSILSAWEGSQTYAIKSPSASVEYVIGTDDVLTAQVNTNIYTLKFVADSAVENIYVNGSLWTEDYGSYSAGEKKITWTIKTGYKDNVKMEVLEVPEGMTVKADGDTLTLSGVASSGNGTGDIKIQLVGTTDNRSSSSSDSNFSMTDILLVLVVLVVVVMGLLVAVRFIKR